MEGRWCRETAGDEKKRTRSTVSTVENVRWRDRRENKKEIDRWEGRKREERWT